jgi:ubiquinone/menaquinone biosynthesis C-methylase UbiE
MKRIKWMHGNAEKTNSKSNSFDLITLTFIAHELPDEATKSILTECYRIAKSGGTIAITDNNPKSKIIQNL